MPSKLVCDIANKYGVILSDRNVTGNHIFDGKTLGTKYQLVEECNRSISCPCSNCMGWSGTEDIPDSDLLHEIAHYAIASDFQKSLPEYGLGQVFGPEYGRATTNLFGTITAPKLVSDSEAILQEKSAVSLEREWSLEY